MNLSGVSKRYAKALFAVSKDANSHAQTLTCLAALAEALSSADAAKFFSDPQVESSKKAKAIAGTLDQTKLPESVKNFITLLMGRKRLAALPEIVKAYEQLIDEESGVTRGEVCSAKPLSGEAVALLENKISNILKKKIILKFKEDPAVIAGVVAKVGGWTFDDSLDLHLRKLKEELLNH